MTETLNTHSTVVLFGKLVEDLQINPKTDNTSQSTEDTQAIARIYGYSFGGAYYEMAGPVLIAVKGEGKAASVTEVPGPGLDDDDPFYRSLLCWTHDKSDKTIRMDLDSGTLEQILLSDSGDGGIGVSGARVSGARVSGARVSGARVSGARISGARLSGARGDASD